MTARRAQLILIVVVALNLRPAVTAVGPLLTEIRHDLHLSGTAAGALTTLPLVCFGSFGLLAPFLRRRPPSEVLMVMSMALLSAGLLLRVVPATTALFAGSLLAGIAISIGNIAVPAVIKRDHPERVTTVTAVYTVAVTIGASAASGFVAPAERLLGSGWRQPLGLLAIPAAAAALCWLPRARRAPAAAVRRGGHAAVWRDRLAWQVTAFFGVQSLLAYVVFAWLPTICQDHGMAKEPAGYVLALCGLTQAVGALAVPVIERRLKDQRPLVVLVVALSLAGFAGIAWAPIASIWFWAVVLGLGQGISFATALSFIGLRSPDAEIAGQLSGMTQGIGYAMSALGPLAIGALHDVSGDWNLPMAVSLGITCLLLLPGLGAGRSRTLRPTPTFMESLAVDQN